MHALELQKFPNASTTTLLDLLSDVTFDGMSQELSPVSHCRLFRANFYLTERLELTSKWTCTVSQLTPSEKRTGPKWCQTTVSIPSIMRSHSCSERQVHLDHDHPRISRFTHTASFIRLSFRNLLCSGSPCMMTTTRCWGRESFLSRTCKPAIGTSLSGQRATSRCPFLCCSAILS